MRARAAASEGEAGPVPGTGRIHILKTDPLAFDAVAAGHKTHEIRFNDRDFKVGDKLVLTRTQHTGQEMKGGLPLVCTGEECERVVSHVLTGYGLQSGWAILSFATPPAAASEAVAPKPLTSAAIEKGWHQTFSTNNPFCPCDLQAFTKAVRWAERALSGATHV